MLLDRIVKLCLPGLKFWREQSWLVNTTVPGIGKCHDKNRDRQGCLGYMEGREPLCAVGNLPGA